MSVCSVNSFPEGEYRNLFTAVAFSSQSCSGKTSLPTKKSYFLTFPDNKAEILVHIELRFARFCFDCFNFLSNIHFIISSS